VAGGSRRNKKTMDIITLKEMMLKDGYSHTSEEIRLTRSENKIPYLRIAKDANGKDATMVSASKRCNEQGIVKKGMSAKECLPLNVFYYTLDDGTDRRKFVGQPEKWQEVDFD